METGVVKTIIERETERDRDRDREKKRETETETETERKRERERERKRGGEVGKGENRGREIKRNEIEAITPGAAYSFPKSKISDACQPKTPPYL